MKLKEYQEQALAAVRGYLELLADWRTKAEEHLDLDIDFPTKAWEKAQVRAPYDSRKNGLGEPLPTFCLKIPTGGGKTLLAVKTVDLVNMVYRRRRTGLVLWIVPTTQIYRQTLQALRDKDHPYRQHLDLASGGRTQILEKTDRFSPLDVEENLVVLMLMLPSANRKTKETLKVFQDSGGFQDFFPSDDDPKGHAALLDRFPNLDTYEKVGGFWGRQVKSSLGNTLRMLAPLIVLDEGHKAYSEGAQETLRGFNPCMIVELSATPTESNVLVDISGRDLHREEMIKLDLHVVNKASPDWKDTLLAGHDRREALEGKARKYEANSGINIRPICLIQVERTGADQEGGKWIHSEQVREHLIRKLGIPEEQIAVKTSEKDELKEVDDVGGLLSRDCPVRYIITKQALQEGWDCSFAYVLVILTNPSSKNSLTQLVGRILRQPFARKTGVPDLDESYVFCFQQRAQSLLECVRAGFEQEGLGDLRAHVSHDGGEGPGGAGDAEPWAMQDKFRRAASQTILPVFSIKEGASWRPVSYEMDIAPRIPWDRVNLDPVLGLTFSMVAETDLETVATLSDSPADVIRSKKTLRLTEGGVHVDAVFMTRQLCDIVPNPWRAHEFATAVLDSYRRRHRGEDKRLADNFVFLIEELKRQLAREKDRLAQEVFRNLLDSGELRLLIIGDDFKFPKKLDHSPGTRVLLRADNRPVQMYLFEGVSEDEFNETERAVAWYLESQRRLFFWFRNRARHDYALQGWREHRIYPDFIFTAADADGKSEFQRVFVVETKGLHLIDSDRTKYIRTVFNICNQQARSTDWRRIAPAMADKTLKFEVLAEDEWRAKLNEMLESTGADPGTAADRTSRRRRPAGRPAGVVRSRRQAPRRRHR